MINQTTLDKGPAPASPDAVKPPQRRARGQVMLWLMVGLGLLGVIATVLRLDGANGQQLDDLNYFYFPAMKDFAADPWRALHGYSAAPTPLYYMLQGLVLAAGGGLAGVKIFSIVLGVATVWVIWAFPSSPARRLCALAVLLISPYFRGQVWYANSDVMAFLLCFIALRPQPAEGRRWMGAILLSAVTVYVRQTFAFLPAYLYLKAIFKERRPFVLITALCALIGLPMLGLIAMWGGIVQPRFAVHVSAAVMPATLAVGISISAFYVIPMMIVRCLTPMRLVRDVIRLPVWVHVIVLGSAVALAVWSKGFDELYGGGLAFLAAKAGATKLGVPLLVSFLPVFVASFYVLALTVAAAPWRNALVFAATLAMSASVLIFQRYFDPLIPLILLLHARMPEIRWLESRGLAWTMALPSLAVAIAASLTH
jgi:hypothetical protein